MSNTRNYFHDRFILFTLTINAFLTAVGVIAILARIGGADENYIQSFRSNLGLSSITVGGLGDILSFVVFMGVVFAAHIFISLKFYHIRKTVAWLIMILTTLLLILAIIVSNALLELR